MTAVEKLRVLISPKDDVTVQIGHAIRGKRQEFAVQVKSVVGGVIGNKASVLEMGRPMEMHILTEGNEQQVALPGEMQQQLETYLQMGLHLREDLDCYSLVHHLAGLPYDSIFERSLWASAEKSSNNAEDFQPGDFVMFYSAQKAYGMTMGELFTEMHCAVSLGRGLFLCKNSTEKGLWVMDMRQIRDAYRAGFPFKFWRKES